MITLSREQLKTRPIAIRFFSKEEHKILLEHVRNHNTLSHTFNLGICSFFYKDTDFSPDSGYSVENGFDDEDCKLYDRLVNCKKESWYKRNNYLILNFKDVYCELSQVIESINNELSN